MANDEYRMTKEIQMSEARMSPALGIWSLVILSSLVIGHSSFGADAPSVSRDIRPILSQHCFKCHGPDQQKNGLRLDDRSVATRAVKSGKTPIVPGRVEASELLRRVTSTDPDERMPHEGEALSAQQIAKLHAWIAN